MKKFLLILQVIFVSSYVFSQEKIDSLAREEPKEYPYTVIETRPVYPGCEGTQIEKADCFNQKVMKLIVANFDMDKINKLGLPGGRYKIIAFFTIDKNGEIQDISVKAPHEEMAIETKRILEKMPKLEPGTQRDKPVKVKYSLPIHIQVDEPVKAKKKRN